MLAVVAAAACAAALAWAYLLAGHGGFWRTDQRLPPRRGAAPAAGSWPAVTAIVPARDEARALPASLPTLLRQEYPGPLAVVLVDDESSDGTALVAAGLGRAAGWAVATGRRRGRGQRRGGRRAGAAGHHGRAARGGLGREGLGHGAGRRGGRGR